MSLGRGMDERSGHKGDDIQRMLESFIRLPEAERLTRLEKLKAWYLESANSDSDRSFFSHTFSNLSALFQKLHERIPKEGFETLTGAYKKKDYQRVLRILDRMGPGQMGLAELEMGADAAYASQNDSLVHRYTDALLQKQPLHFRALLLKGGNFYRQKNFPEAASCFNKILTFQPQNKIALEYIARMKTESSWGENTPTGAARRRWRRKPVFHQMMCNAYDQLFAQNVKVRSLSAGGCLVEAPELPKEFNFSLFLDKNQQVQGYAEVIYKKSDTLWGVKFTEISPEAEDVINTRVSS